MYTCTCVYVHVCSLGCEYEGERGGEGGREGGREGPGREKIHCRNLMLPSRVHNVVRERVCPLPKVVYLQQVICG